MLWAQPAAGVPVNGSGGVVTEATDEAARRRRGLTYGPSWATLLQNLHQFQAVENA